MGVEGWAPTLSLSQALRGAKARTTHPRGSHVAGADDDASLLRTDEALDARREKVGILAIERRESLAESLSDEPLRASIACSLRRFADFLARLRSHIRCHFR